MSASFVCMILCCVFLAFLNIIYFVGKRNKSYENNLLGTMLIMSFLGTLLDIICYLVTAFTNPYELLCTFVNKLALIYMVAFVLVFTVYVLVVGYKKETNVNRHYALIKGIMTIIWFFSMLAICFLPVYIYRSTNTVYSFGPGVNVVYGVTSLCATLGLYSILKNANNLGKKFIPTILFVVSCIAGIILRVMRPEWMIATVFEAVIVFVMYLCVDKYEEKKKIKNETILKENKITEEVFNSEYNIRDVINQLDEVFKGQAGDKILQFKISFDPMVPEYIYGDFTRVRQICLNLLSNSIEYTNSGSIELFVDAIIKRDKIRLIISVSDTGSGMTKEEVEKISLSLEQTTENDDPTSLYATKKIVEDMNGKLIVQSDYGMGSKFTIAIDQKVSK